MHAKLAATKVKMSGNEKKKRSEQEHMRYSLHKTCSNEVSESFTM